jgi:hypothetical protein
LALITGWKETFDQIPGIILALPYGFMADRIGRKRVVMLSLLGLMMQEITIRVICCSPLLIPEIRLSCTTVLMMYRLECSYDSPACDLGYCVIPNLRRWLSNRYFDGVYYFDGYLFRRGTVSPPSQFISMPYRL